MTSSWLRQRKRSSATSSGATHARPACWPSLGQLVERACSRTAPHLPTWPPYVPQSVGSGAPRLARVGWPHVLLSPLQPAVASYDNYWSTTALYLTPRGASQLLSNTAERGSDRQVERLLGASFWGVCQPPDVFTRNLCTAHTETGLPEGRSALLKPMKHGVCLEPRFRPSLEPRPAGIYGFGHFLQDKVQTVPLVHADNRREAKSDFLAESRDACSLPATGTSGAVRNRKTFP